MNSAFEAFIVFSIIYVLLAWALYAPYKCGQIYLGAIYCMMGAAYFTGVVTRDFGWSPVLALGAAPIFGAFLAILPAIGLRRASGMAVAIGSMSLIFILQTIILNTKYLGHKVGFFGIPVYDNVLPASLIGLAIAAYIVWRIDISVIGRASEVTFHSHDLAESNGINPGNVGMFLQTISGMLAGYAGGIFALQVSTLFATQFGFSMLLNVVVSVFAGGATTFWGPLLIAPIIFGFPLFLPEQIATWKDLIYGVLLVIVLLVRPEGLITKNNLLQIKKIFKLRSEESSGCKSRLL